MKHVKEVFSFIAGIMAGGNTLDKRALNLLIWTKLTKKKLFLLDQGLTINDHQTWSAKILDKFIEFDPFTCRKHLK